MLFRAMALFGAPRLHHLIKIAFWAFNGSLAPLFTWPRFAAREEGPGTRALPALSYKESRGRLTTKKKLLALPMGAAGDTDPLGCPS